MTRRGFITGGTWCVDRNITVPAWPREDCVTFIEGVELAGGGSACNFAVDIRRLDPTIPVETMGLVGQDAEGDFLAAIADEHGVGRDGLARTSASPTQMTDAYQSRASGLRTHLAFVNAAALLTPDHFDFTATTARHVHLGLPGLHDMMDNPWQGDPSGWVSVLKRARAVGLEADIELVTIDPVRTCEIVRPCLPHLSVLVVNDSEIGALAEVDTVRDGETDVTACEAAAAKVLGMGAMDTVVVHFPAGAVLVSQGGGALYQPSVNVPESAIAGPNGAGDAFAAGYFYGRHEGWAPEACLRMAHAASAASLREVGTYSAVEQAEACLNLAEAWGWRSGGG